MFDKVIVDDFIKKKFKWVHENDSLKEVLSLFDDETDVLLVIDDNNEYSGILTERMVVRSGLLLPNKTVKELVAFAPKVERNTSIQECARLMLEYDVLNLPVFENDSLIGVVDETRLLSSLAAKIFGKKSVRDFMSLDTIIVSSKDKVAGVLRLFRDSHISRAPVVDDGIIVGIITLHDIFSKLIFPQEQETFDFIIDNNQSILDTYVEKIMSHPVFTSTVHSSVKDIIDQMIENDVNSIVIIDDQKQLEGMITKRDLLEPLSEERHDIVYPYIQINSKIENINRKELISFVTHFIDKYKDKLGDASFNIYLKEHKEKLNGDRLIYTRFRINSAYGRFAVKSEGWGPNNSLKNALLILDKQINKKMSKEKKLKKLEKKQLMNYIKIDSLS